MCAAVGCSGGTASIQIALAHEHTVAHQAPNDLLDEEGIATGARGGEILQILQGVD